MASPDRSAVKLSPQQQAVKACIESADVEWLSRLLAYLMLRYQLGEVPVSSYHWAYPLVVGRLRQQQSDADLAGLLLEIEHWVTQTRTQIEQQPRPCKGEQLSILTPQ